MIPINDAALSQRLIAALLNPTGKEQTKPMATTTTKNKEIHVADVVRSGEKLIVPESMPLLGAIDVLQRKLKMEEEVVRVQEKIHAFPWDGAIAMKRVLERRLGAAISTTTPGLFGTQNPPTEIAIETGFGQTELVTWGRYILPGIKDGDDWLQTMHTEDDGRVVFMLGGQVRRKYLPLVNALADDIRAELRDHSIYRGRAFRISFYDDSNDKRELPTINFLDTSGVDLSSLVFSDTVQAAIDTNIFTPIRYAKQAAKLGVPTKRGVLLAGQYGTGKTLTAYATAKVCEDNGWTFVYIAKANELPDAIRFANAYGPAVLFAEDIDRTTSGERSTQLDQILNTIDGIDSKGSQVMVVLTTNHLEKINPAMLREGRLDAAIEVLAPDQDAVVRLIRHYAGAMLDPDTDVTAVAGQLAGQIPATIREVVERSKLYWLRRTAGKEKNVTLAEDDIHYAASTVLAQRKLTHREPKEKKTGLELFASGVGTAIAQGLGLAGHAPSNHTDMISTVYGPRIAHHLNSTEFQLAAPDDATDD